LCRISNLRSAQKDTDAMTPSFLRLFSSSWCHHIHCEPSAYRFNRHELNCSQDICSTYFFISSNSGVQASATLVFHEYLYE